MLRESAASSEDQRMVLDADELTVKSICSRLLTLILEGNELVMDRDGARGGAMETVTEALDQRDPSTMVSVT